jgi:PAS domain S-box-containing protein
MVTLRDSDEHAPAQRLLDRNEAWLRSIVDSAMDAIITIDATQHVVMFNTAAEAMFLCTRAEAVGAPLSMLIPERFRTGHAEHVQRFGESEMPSRRMNGARIVMGLRRNGEEFPLEASISQVRDGEARFYTVILRDISDRLSAEEELRRSREELQELGSTAQVAREQEKSRIARELHDELGQALTLLQMDVAWCKARVAGGQGDFLARIERMETLLKSTVSATRRIAADLRPLMLDDLGLVPAVEWLVENFTQHTGVPCRLAIGRRELELDSARSNAVFRVVQESLTNIAKHARAGHAEVAIAVEDEQLIVRVRDDGVGFVAQAPRKPNSFGLVGLRERAAILKGTASITTAVGGGTMIEVRLPMPARAGCA